MNSILGVNEKELTLATGRNGVIAPMLEGYEGSVKNCEANGQGAACPWVDDQILADDQKMLERLKVLIQAIQYVEFSPEEVVKLWIQEVADQAKRYGLQRVDGMIADWKKESVRQGGNDSIIPLGLVRWMMNLWQYSFVPMRKELAETRDGDDKQIEVKWYQPWPGSRDVPPSFEFIEKAKERDRRKRIYRLRKDEWIPLPGFKSASRPEVVSEVMHSRYFFQVRRVKKSASRRPMNWFEESAWEAEQIRLEDERKASLKGSLNKLLQGMK